MKAGNEIKAGQRRRKAEDKRIKTEANTPRAFNPPNYSRTQKPRKPRKAPKQYKHTQSPQNPLKTPLESQIKAYSAPTPQEQKQQRDERQGERDGTHTAGHQKPRSPAHLWTSGHDHRPTKEDESSTTKAPEVKYIFVFAVFSLPKSRENTKASK